MSEKQNFDKPLPNDTFVDVTNNFTYIYTGDEFIGREKEAPKNPKIENLFLVTRQNYHNLKSETI